MTDDDRRANATGLLLDRETRLRCESGVLSSRIGDEIVVLAEQRGVYFGLDEVGAFIFEWVGRGHSLGQIHANITDAFDSDPQTAWDDLVDFSLQMIHLGLLVRDRS